uniref:Uncharacterized protein n=1 Tax=Anguilla anguilla TaxID=7936 RepID=A0A0E9T8I9_ANGAN
MTWCPLWHRA